MEVWGRQAETCKQYLTKGRPVFIEGSLKFDQWESPEGQKKSKLRVRAERVQFLGAPGGAGGGQGGQGGQSGSGGRSSYSGGGGAPGEQAQRPARPAATPASGGGDDHPPMPEDDDIPF